MSERSSCLAQVTHVRRSVRMFELQLSQCRTSGYATLPSALSLRPDFLYGLGLRGLGLFFVGVNPKYEDLTRKKFIIKTSA